MKNSESAHRTRALGDDRVNKAISQKLKFCFYWYRLVLIQSQFADRHPVEKLGDLVHDARDDRLHDGRRHLLEDLLPVLVGELVDRARWKMYKQTCFRLVGIFF